MNEDHKKYYWTHNDKGGEYAIAGYPLHRKDDGSWAPGVLYGRVGESLDDGYTRTQKGFLLRFKKVGSE